ncbi:MAG: hypothetical protein WKG06_40110 [Segetibacter sp.]
MAIDQKRLVLDNVKRVLDWDDQETIELQPDDFCDQVDERCSNSFTLKKMFFLALNTFPLDLYTKAKNAGIVLIVFRILDYLPELIGKDLADIIIKWTSAAVEFSLKALKEGITTWKVVVQKGLE